MRLDVYPRKIVVFAENSGSLHARYRQLARMTGEKQNEVAPRQSLSILETAREARRPRLNGFGMQRHLETQVITSEHSAKPCVP